MAEFVAPNYKNSIFTIVDSSLKEDKTYANN
jgi:hypothetical protein